MSKARKIVTYLMVGMMVLTNFQNRLYADDEGAEASPSSSASSESSSASSSSDSGGGSSDGGNSGASGSDTSAGGNSGNGDSGSTSGSEGPSDNSGNSDTSGNPDTGNGETSGDTGGTDDTSNGEGTSGENPTSENASAGDSEKEENADPATEETTPTTDQTPTTNTPETEETQNGEQDTTPENQTEPETDQPSGSFSNTGASEQTQTPTTGTTATGEGTGATSLTGDNNPLATTQNTPENTDNTKEETEEEKSDTPSGTDTDGDTGLSLQKGMNLLKSPLRSTFTYDTITISKPAGYTGEGPENFVIMDRNLGATSNDIDSEDSYGYHYQWGNNYGFPYDEEITTGTTQVDASGYGPRNPYSSDTFIIGNEDWSSVQNDNLRGGANDSASNNRGLDDIEDTATERQGPCPDGYHVPSAGEWSKVVEYRAFENGQTVNGSDVKYFYNVSNEEAFRSALKIPFAGGRNYADGSVGSIGRHGGLWSSSPSSQSARLLYVYGDGHVYANYNYRRAYGLAVRCFQNSPENPPQTSSLSLSASSGGVISKGTETFSTWSGSFSEGTTITIDGANLTVGEQTFTAQASSGATFSGWNNTCGTTITSDCSVVAEFTQEEISGLSLSFDSDGGSIIPAVVGLETGADISGYRPKKDPTKAGQMFLGWFDANGERFMFEGKTISEDITLTAHWAPFNDLVYTGIIDGVLKTIVLMDRNLGATSLDLSSLDSDGYFYQWGNNFGFDTNVANIEFTTAKADVSGYGPENPYYGEKFIKQTDWTTSANLNLRGGNGDNFSNNFDNGNERIQRQGPCPEGYYIPSLEEGNELVTLYLSNKGISTTSIGGYDYPATVGKQDDARYMLDEEHEADFRQTFNLPQAGMIRGNKGNKERHRTDTTNNRQQAFLSTSTPHGTGKYMLMETNVGGNNKGNYINVGGWINSIGDATPIRCFKSITETPIDADPEVTSGAIVITTEAGKTVAHIYDNGEPLELDDDIEVDEVILHRTFTVNVPSTVVLPFDIEAGKYEGGTFYLFDGVEWNNEEETWEIKTIQADAIEAHTPYLFVPSATTLTITGPVTLKEGKPQDLEKGDWTFKGIYEKKNWNADSSTEYGFSTTGTFSLMGENASLNPMRAYLSYNGDHEEDICEDLVVVVDPTVMITTDGKGTVSQSHVTVASGTSVSFDSNTVTIGDTTITASPKSPTVDKVYSFSSWENTCGDTITHSCTIRATFSESTRSYDIKFNNADGSNLWTKRIAYGEMPEYDQATPTQAADAEYTYTFSGWNPEVHAVDGNNIYTATYTETKRSYEVNWKNADGTPLTESEVLEYGTVPTYKGTTPTKTSSEGHEYTFIGWTDGTSHYTKDEELPAIQGETTFTAEFDETVLTYPIRFIGFNGEILQESNVEYGETPAYTGATPTRDGFTFSGWDSAIASVNGAKDYTAVFEACTPCNAGTGASCSLSVVANQCKYTNACTLGYENISTTTGNNPSCSLISYPLSYTGLQGAENPNPASYTYEEEINLIALSKEGYTFLGWFLDDEKVETIERHSTGAKTFTAKWQVKPSFVTFDFANGETPVTITGDYGDPFKAPANPTREGHTFSGWDSSIPSEMPENPLTITAVWNTCTPCTAETGAMCSLSVVANQCKYTNACLPGYTALQNATNYNPSCTIESYEITYNLDGGENHPSNPSSYTIESEKIDLQNPTKEGYTFVRWEPVDFINQGSTGAKTFNAVWNSVTYTISFVSKNSEVPSPITGNINDSVKAKWPQTLPTRSGYTFQGWVVSGNYQNYSNGARYDENTEVFKENIVLKPKWNECNVCKPGTGATCSLTVVDNACHYETACEAGYTVDKNSGKYNPTCKPLSYTISYELNGGDENPNNPTSYTSLDEDIILEAPTKLGYTGHWDKGNLIPHGSTGNKTFSAVWEPNKYQIIFNFANETSPLVLTQDYDSVIEAPEDPTREEHTFSGWDKEIPSNMPAEMTLITALWNTCPVCAAETGASCSLTVTGNQCTYINACLPGYTGLQNAETNHPSCSVIPYQITYELSGGTNDASNPTTYTVESETINLQNPTKEGYTFAGWTPEAMISHGSTGDKTFTANWTVNQYTLTFNADNGTAPFIITGNYGESFNTPTDPTKEGHTFSGWNPAVPATMPMQYPTITAEWNACQVCEAGNGASCSLTVTGNQCTYINACLPGYTGLQNATSYNPSCSVITYPITYNLNGGTTEDALPTTYTVETETITLPQPTRTGYTFAGWTPSMILAKGSTGEQTFTANWTVNQYTITFNTDGGTKIKSITQDFGTVLPEITNPTKEGYTFAGWEEGELPETMQAENLTFTAKWSINSYEITWKNSNGETLKVEELDYGTMPSYNGSTPEKEADKQYTYTFSHWEPVVKKVEKNQTYTAIYSKTVNQYLITFKNQNNETISTGSYPYGTDIINVVSPEPPFQTGYKFVGWKLASYILGGTPTTVTSNLEFVPDYIKDEYSITYILEGNLHATIPLNFQAQIIPISMETRTGYTFSGWTPRLPYNMPARDLTVEGEYVKNKRFLHFNTNGGNTIPIRELEYDAPIVLPDTPTKEGFVFQGWDKQDTITRMPDENTWFNAQWTGCAPCEPGKGATCEMSVVNNVCHYETACKDGYEVDENNGKYNPTCKTISYSISYELDGGENNENNPDSYDVESPLITLSAPTKEGYTFAGWTPNNKITRGSTGDREFTANWTANQYFIKFDGNGGTVAKPRIAGDFGSNIEIPADPTREGYTFAGWSPEIPATMPITPETGLLITAQWTINSHTLTFDFDNGDPRSIKTLEYGTPIEIPEIPLKKGHKFSGWSEEIPATMPDHDVTITAQYRTNIHTITFDTKGGTPIAPITTGFDYDITAPADPTKPGYTFLGWDKEIPDTMPDADMTITANWDINQYTLTLKLDNGEEDIVITGVYHSAISAQPDPQREGHTFKGWSKTIPTEMQAEDMIITANWEINKNTLTFNLDNGDDPIVSILNFGDTITVPENFSRTGYTFSGWNKDIPATMPDTGLVITALWNVNQYTFTFDTDGGTPIDPIVKDYREVVTKPADPTKTGYTFSGWDKTIPAKMPAHDDTFTVQWKMNQYVISFDADGGTPVEAITADYNSGIIAPANPTKTGYLFSGWMPALPQKMPGYNIDVIAQWTPIKYTLTFDTDGGTPVEAITADYNSGIIAPENPTKTGYIFSGWMPTIPEKMPLNGLTVKADWIVDTETPYLVEHQKEELNGTYSISEVFTGKGETNGKVTPEVKTYEGFISPSSEEITIKPDGSTKLIYKYARKEIVLHFDTDGGSNISDKTGKYGAVVTVSDPTKRGYHFSGWMPEIPSHFPAENETYTAKWNAKSYSIDYDLDEGMYGESYPTVAKYDEKIIIDNPTKTGYLFKGWKITGMDQGEHYYGDATTNDSMINETTETEFKNLTATERGRVSFKALWIPRTDIHYTVNHHREKLDEGYNTEVEILTGTVNGITNAQKKIYSGFTFTGTIQQQNIAPDGSTVIDLYYTRNTYDITFDTDGGTPVDTISKLYESPLKMPKDPVKTGYTFKGWSSEFPDIMPLSGLKLKAQWETNAYIITYLSNGEEWGTVPHTSTRVLYDQEITIPNPIKTGYTFSGWRIVLMDNGEHSYGTFKTTEGTIENTKETVFKNLHATNGAPVLFIANWIANTDTKYTVKHHKEALTGDVEIETEIFEGVTNEITSVHEKIYQGFSLSGQIKDQKIKSDGSTVIDVYYKRNIHTISFDTKGGTEIPSIKKKYESDLSGVVTTIPTKTGSTFDGWEQNLPATMPDEDIKLVAKWSEKVYTAKFYTDGGTEIEDITGYYNDDLILPDNPIKTGYTFVKWTPKTQRRFPDHDLQYTAIWNPVEYTISFDTDGGTEIPAITGHYGDMITGNFVTTKTGSSFIGWSENIPSTMPAENKTIKALWNKEKYTLTFDSNGGTEVKSIEGYYGDYIEKPSDPTKTGYMFLGWEPNIKKLKTMPAENLTYTAQWEAKVYTITFDTDGGNEINPITQKYGTDITSPANPTKVGYTFNGWSKAIPSSMPAEDITIKAKWKINQYTMTFDANGGKFENGQSQKIITKNYGENFKVPTNPKKENAEFKGWSGYVWNEDDIPTIPAENKTFTAKWNDCEVCNPENATCTVNVIDNKCTYTTFCIDGYNYNGTIYPENEGTAHPKCIPTVYSITYDLNDETGIKAVNPNTTGQYTIEDQNFALLDPIRSGYNFVRWEDSMKKTVTEINTQTKKNIRLKAVWSSKTIHVTFDKNGGEGGTNELWYLFDKNKYFKDSSLKAPFEGITRPTRAGYTFVNYHGDGQFGGENGEQYVSYYYKSASALNEFRNSKYYQEDLDKKESKSLTEFASDFANDIYGDEEGNVTLVAEWKPNRIHLTLDEKGGTGGTKDIWYAFDTSNFYDDEELQHSIEKITNPTKTGYTFLGYQVANGEKYIAYNDAQGNKIDFAEDLAHEISQDTTLVAIWEANTIKITLDPTPGTGGTKVFYYKYEDPNKKIYSDSGCTQSITAIERPIRPGYSFMNYHGDGTSGGGSGERFVAYENVEFASNLHDAIYQNATLYATWEANTIKITLDKKGGTGGIDEFYYKFDTERFYSDENLSNEIEEITVPTKRGYTFQSYDTGEMAYITYTSEHAHFKSGFASSFTEDTTLVANWGANKIHISLNKEGGTGGLSEFWYYFDTPKYYSKASCASGTEITEVGHPIKTGYIFKDYYSTDKKQRFVSYEGTGDRKELGDDDIYRVVSSDATLKARWTPKTIHITLDKNEGIEGTDEFWYQYQTGAFYADKDLTQEITKIEIPTRTGYVFTHYVGSGNTGGIVEKRNYTTSSGKLSTEIRDNIYGDEEGNATLYAQWDANPYVIRYQNTADENDFIDEIVSFDTSVTITGNSFIRTGYTFSGWIDEEENIYQPGDSGKNFVDSGMFILKTIWQANEYTVKFLAGEGTGTMEDQTFVWDTEAKLHANTFTKNGYNFKHWIAENGQTYSNLSSVKNLIDSGTISLLAQWEAIPVQRSSGGGGGGGGSSMRRDNCPNGDHSNSYYDGKCEKEEKSDKTHGSAEELTEEEGNEIEEVDGVEYTKRDISLYEWAKKYKLTSMETIRDFRGEDGLTRAEMSKIISIFAKEYLEAKEKEIKACSNFKDITKIKSDLHDYIITSCKLGYMGRTSDGKGVLENFDPHSQVTKAEAVTIISRLFRGNEYANKKGEKWYEGHLNHLIAIGVVENDEDIEEPFARKDFYMILKKLYQLELD